jgi:outer membrane protein assembly factor BamB
MHSRKFSRSGAALIALAFVFTLHAGDWPQWRGPNRDGHAAESFQLTSLPKELKPIWKLPIGPGFSAPIVVGGTVIYADDQDGKEVLHRIDALTHAEKWKTTIAEAVGDEWGNGPRSTPFVDGDRVYYQSMNGEFRCVNLVDGKPRWSVSFTNYGVNFLGSKANEGTASRRGNNGSGVVEGDYVYVPIGGKGASIVCFDKMTGKEVWKALNDEAAYSSFVVGTLAGTKQLVALTADALVGVDLKNGKQLWRVPYRTNAKRHACTPVINGDTVTVASHSIGLACTKITKEGDTFTASPVWTTKSLTINLATPVVVDGFFYTYGPMRTKDFVCVDAKDGAIKWQQAGFGIGKDATDYASTIVVGKTLLVLTYDGQLVLLATNPEKYTELGRAQVCGKTWSHMAFADGKLFVRDGRELQCFDLTPKVVAVR